MSTTRNVKVIFLDLGGVVLEINWQRTLDLLGVTDPEKGRQVLTLLRDWPIHHALETGNCSTEDFYAQIKKRLEIETTALEIERAWNGLILGELAGIHEIFDTYQGRIPLVALSNTNQPHYDYFMREFPVLKRFDHVIASQRIGIRKPDPAIYRYALNFAGCLPDEAIFIDDHLPNVVAARELGMQAFQTINSPQATLAILQQNIKFI